MNAIDCITGRSSVRAFRPDPVPRELLLEVIEAARWAPSYKNTQPWEVAILSGDKKAALSELLLKKLENRDPITPDLTTPKSWPEAEQKRIDHLIQSRQEATGIDLGAPENVLRSKRANFRFYNAPHGIFLFQDNALTEWSLFDLGLFAQNLMLSARAKGLGTVPQAFLTDYAKEVKEFLGLAESKRLVLGISIGYPDPESPANAMRSDRTEASELIRWYE
jgi:nitroreductase